MWTPEQKAAIDIRDRNILVSAAAGSGKTAVLVQRVLERICDTTNPVDIDRLLIVTFTNAAALEMKERIGDGITKRLEEDPNNTHIQKQLHLLQRSSISTIHSFCLKVIRNYFHQIELDPAFRIGNDAELNLIKGETLENTLEEFFDSGREDFLELVDSYTTPKSTQRLEEIILKLYTFSQSMPWPNVWLDHAVEELNQEYESIDETKWSQIIHEDIIVKLDATIVAAHNAMALCHLGNGPEHYEPMLKNDLEQLEECYKESDSLVALIKSICNIQFMALSRKRFECDIDIREQVKDIRNNQIKKPIEDIQKDFPIGFEKDMLLDITKVSRTMKILVEVVQVFGEKYQQAKGAKYIVDYNDLEHYCLDILLDKDSKEEHIIPSAVSKELQEFYDEIYIDEYQDSNIVQETILSVISRQDQNRFMVGDIKQSIYRFRLANPLLFRHKHDTYDEYDINQGNDSLGDKVYIDLAKNFRSRGNILDGINFIFEQIMNRQVGEVDYNHKAALYTGLTYKEPEEEIEVGGPTELHLISTSNESDEIEEDSMLKELSKREVEAMLVASMVRDMLDEKKGPTHVYDKKKDKYRKIEPKDIVILLRTTLNTADHYLQALLSVGVGAFADVATGYFETIEIKTILALLSIIDNPMQDIPLLTVLRSPIVGLSLDELAIIRKSQKYGTYYDALEGYISQIEGLEMEEDKLVTKLKAFRKDLSTYRKWAIDFTMDELLSKLFVGTGYYQYVGMLPTGEQKQANLRILKKHAAEFEESSFTGLFNFMNYIDRVKKTSGDFAEAKTVGENENLVRIMSIHKSKGLEFPVVFVCATDKRFNNQDLIEPVLVHYEYGLGAKYIDVNHRVIYDTFPRIAISKKIKMENISEEMRVLYVALTRAKEKLIITGSVDNFEKSVKAWGQNLNKSKKALGTYTTMSANCYLDWIGAALIRHPDASEMRKIARGSDGGNIVKDEKSRWSFSLWGKHEIPVPKQLKEKELEIKKEELHHWDTDKVYGKYKEEIEKRLDWEYGFEAATKLPVKMTVSEIKQRWNTLDEDSEIFSFGGTLPSRRPSFMEEKQKYTSAEKGTMIHSVFQHIDLTNCQDEQCIKKQIDKMIIEGKADQAILDIINMNTIVDFANSPIINRIKQSSQVYKEQQFVFLLDAKEIIPSFEGETYQEDIMVQGVIDCFFEEDDGYVLVDYKTDYIPAGKDRSTAIDNIKKRYEKQIEIYARAIEDITQKPIKEKYLYLYSANEWVKY